MVDKKAVAAGVAVLAAVGTGVALALRGDEEPVDEGAPEGEVSLEITEIQGFSFKDVQGQTIGELPATLTANGICTAGYPLPSMLIEIYIDGTLRATKTIATVVLGTTYPLDESLTTADIGDHTAYARMVLSNPLGDYEFDSLPAQSFTLGEEPPGDVTLTIKLA